MDLFNLFRTTLFSRIRNFGMLAFSSFPVNANEVIIRL